MPIKRRLKQLAARYIGEKRQIDTYYLPIGRPHKANKGTVLRTRYDSLTGKARLELHMATNDFASYEYEVDVSDYQKIQKILKEMKFCPEFVINKHRQVYQKGQLEIVLDTVKRLGKFIEVELQGKDTAENRRRVTNFMLSLGAQPKDLIIGIHYNGLMLRVLGKKYAYF